MNKQLIPLEWNNQRIMTTKTLAECYETEEKNIQMNFKRNSDRFIEGRHYYLLKGDELKEFKNLPTVSGLVDKRISSLMLWTEIGKNFSVNETTYKKYKNN